MSGSSIRAKKNSTHPKAGEEPVLFRAKREEEVPTAKTGRGKLACMVRIVSTTCSRLTSNSGLGIYVLRSACRYNDVSTLAASCAIAPLPPLVPPLTSPQPMATKAQSRLALELR